MQRLAVLTTALGRSPPDPDLIYEAMKDRVHQPYRKSLVCYSIVKFNRLPLTVLYLILCYSICFMQIPGLPEILSSLTPVTHPGLLGICLSGAGPTILALATKDFDAIASAAKNIFKEFGVDVDWKLLEVSERSEVIYL